MALLRNRVWALYVTRKAMKQIGILHVIPIRLHAWGSKLIEGLKTRQAMPLLSCACLCKWCLPSSATVPPHSIASLVLFV